MDIDQKTSRKYTIHPWKVMMWVFLVTVMVLFATFTLLFMKGKELSHYFNYTFPFWAWIGIGILGISSFSFEQARKQLHLNQPAKATQWLTATLLLGLLFIGTQMGFFASLFSQQVVISPQNTRPGYLYILTSLHALHVVAGMIVLFFCRRALRRKPHAPKTSVTLSVSGIFWHFLGALWLYLVLIMFIMR
jgi:cytochrome c oxidase subunit 3